MSAGVQKLAGPAVLTRLSQLFSQPASDRHVYLVFGPYRRLRPFQALLRQQVEAGNLGRVAYLSLNRAIPEHIRAMGGLEEAEKLADRRRDQALSPLAARAAAEEFRRRYAREFPSAVAGLEDDFEACIAHLRLPIAHRKAIRTTNPLERLFGEARRRTTVIPHAFGERAVLKLMFAALTRASQSWRRLVISEFELKQIEELKTELQTEFRQRTAPATSTASRLHFSSNNKT